MSGIPERARPHHWGFANAWLRSSFDRKPETIVAAIARAPGPEPVVDAWRNFAKTLEDEDRLNPEGLETDSYRVPSDAEAPHWYLAVVTMPEPEGIEEAWMVGLAVRPEDGELRAAAERDSPRESTETRYFVLERSKGGGARFIEWVGDEQEERAPNPDPVVEAFARAIRDTLP